MKVLLDTNALIWMAYGDSRILSVSDLILDHKNKIFISTISLWEIAIKFRIGKIDVDTIEIREKYLNEESDFDELPLSSKYLESLLLLQMYHKDPFDHMILAQAKYENMTIITGDKIFKEYLPETILI